MYIRTGSHEPLYTYVHVLCIVYMYVHTLATYVHLYWHHSGMNWALNC